jgi:hypothetical protein
MIKVQAGIFTKIYYTPLLAIVSFEVNVFYVRQKKYFLKIDAIFL